VVKFSNLTTTAFWCRGQVERTMGASGRWVRSYYSGWSRTAMAWWCIGCGADLQSRIEAQIQARSRFWSSRMGATSGWRATGQAVRESGGQGIFAGMD